VNNFEKSVGFFVVVVGTSVVVIGVCSDLFGACPDVDNFSELILLDEFVI